MAEQLKKYMEKLDDLPPFIRKNAEEIRELDEKVEKIMHEIEVRTVAHVKNLKKTTKEQRVKWYKEVQAMYKEADKLSERKVKLAQKMYDTVDTHIKEMDQQLVEFQEFQIKKYSAGHGAKAGTSNSDNQKRKGSVAAIKGDKRKKPGDPKAPHPDGAAFMDTFKPAAIAPVDMPVDPNEPTYCICHQVSFGQMVACDGPDCKNEWFHFQCVGLTSSPVGKWYCDQCKEARKKKIKQ
ncbi:PHD-finger [Ancylostoma caninum]|uniref:Inhibitor of growth protein n=1 Tax=Ancylostoma caninum TaxID=29170 RepID=A0A368HE12_ANCCA|nr:PHD-finger [Ancylostoma caninum]